MTTFKYNGIKSEAVMLLSHLCFGLGYRVTYDRWKDLLDLAIKWDSEKYYQFQETLAVELQKICREKYILRPYQLISVTGKQISMALPYNKEGDRFGIQITWKNAVDFTFYACVKSEEMWLPHYTRLLLKLAYDMRRIVKSVTIDDKTLKVGEWLAALMFQLCGDRAGMLATLDEAQDR